MALSQKTLPDVARDTRTRVTVVVPARDAPTDLAELSAALDRQTLARGRFEVVVADDGSDSPAAAELATEDGHLRVLLCERRNSYAARNAAAAAGSAPVLAFCDADCRPEPDWLERGLAAVEEADLVGGLIRFVVPERLSTWGLLEMDSFLDQEVAVRSGYAVTANLFVRREAFQAVGGFDASQPNQGDYDFVKRAVAAGARLAFAPDVVVRHPVRDGARPFLTKLWNVNRRYAEREATRRRRPEGLKLRSWIPVVQTARGRRRAGKSLRLDRRRLASHAVEPGPLQDLLALPLLYVFMPYLRCVAQLCGWWAGSRVRRRTEARGAG